MESLILKMLKQKTARVLFCCEAFFFFFFKQQGAVLFGLLSVFSLAEG